MSLLWQDQNENAHNKGARNNPEQERLEGHQNVTDGPEVRKK